MPPEEIVEHQMRQRQNLVKVELVSLAGAIVPKARGLDQLM
jgi:hypothetical protein